MLRWLQLIVPVLVLGLGLGLRVADPVPLQQLRFLAFDQMQILEPRVYDGDEVVLVDVGDASLRRHGQWPWPRTLLAKLVRELQEAGARAIAIDAIFPEPDRTSPAQIVQLWPRSPETEALHDAVAKGILPDHDTSFVRAITRGRVVIGFALDPLSDMSLPNPKTGVAYGGDSPVGYLHTEAGVVTSLEAMTEVADGLGSVNVWPDPDGRIRRVPLMVALGDRVYPSLAAEALRIATDGRAYVVVASNASNARSFGQHTGITQIRIGQGHVVPTDATGSVWLYDTGHKPERAIPAWEVLAGSYDRDRIAGRIVFIGTSARGLKDRHAIATRTSVPGVELHGQIVEQILSGTFLERPDWADGAELVTIAVLGLATIVGLLVQGWSGIWVAFIGGVLAALNLGWSWLAFSEGHLLLDPVYPAMVGLATFLSALLLRYLRTENEKRYVRAAFSRYMSPDLVERLADDPGQLQLGGEMRELTILFSDVRGFTTISEQFDATGLTNFINRLLTPLTDVILATGGTIDKYMGDAIMAFWNAPLDVPAHGVRACDAALRMLACLEELNRALAAEAEAEGRSFIPVRIGIGINTGECCVGNMGSEYRFDYSVLGDDVNLASRLEGQCKTYGVEIIVSDSTRAQAPEFAALELDLIQVKGRTRPARMFTLLGDVALARSEAFQAHAADHAAMLDAYRNQDWGASLQQLERCRETALGARLAPLYDLFAARITRFRSEPPPPEWDGVFVAVEK